MDRDGRCGRMASRLGVAAGTREHPWFCRTRRNWDPAPWKRLGPVVSGHARGRGDRMYVRAEVEFPSGLAGGIQIGGPSGFYRSAMVERLDGPATAVLVIDEIVK
jgi:hypothetical protein